MGKKSQVLAKRHPLLQGYAEHSNKNHVFVQGQGQVGEEGVGQERESWRREANMEKVGIDMEVELRLRY